MGLFYNYNKTGSGVDKNAPKKSRIAVFFEILLRKFWKLMEVNLLYTLFFMPLVLGYYGFFNVSDGNMRIIIAVSCALVFCVCFGPATAGVFKVVRNYSLERHSFILADFKKGFTESFRKALALGLIDIFIFISVCAAFVIYPRIAQSQGYSVYVMFIFSVSLGAVAMMTSFYAFLMIVATEISFKNIIKNSVILAFMAMKKTVITFVITILISGLFVIMTLYNLVTLFALPFVPAAILMLIISYNCYPVIRKYVVDPYYEQIGEKNPEYEDEEEDEDETIFEDMGGKEKPIDNTKKAKKGKTIS